MSKDVWMCHITCTKQEQHKSTTRRGARQHTLLAITQYCAIPLDVLPESDFSVERQVTFYPQPDGMLPYSAKQSKCDSKTKLAYRCAANQEITCVVIKGGITNFAVKVTPVLYPVTDFHTSVEHVQKMKIYSCKSADTNPEMLVPAGIFVGKTFSLGIFAMFSGGDIAYGNFSSVKNGNGTVLHKMPFHAGCHTEIKPGIPKIFIFAFTSIVEICSESQRSVIRPKSSKAYFVKCYRIICKRADQYFKCIGTGGR